MRKTIRDRLAACRLMDWALLYLRLFTGGIMLMHNVWKMQNYNEIVDAYPMIGGNSAATFVVFAVAEVVLAVMLIFGLWVRWAAAILAVAMLVSILFLFPGKGLAAAEQQFVYMGVYVFLIISGAGYYSFDTALIGRQLTADKNH